MSQYTCFTKLKHLIFWNGGSTSKPRDVQSISSRPLVRSFMAGDAWTAEPRVWRPPAGLVHANRLLQRPTYGFGFNMVAFGCDHVHSVGLRTLLYPNSRHYRWYIYYVHNNLCMYASFGHIWILLIYTLLISHFKHGKYICCSNRHIDG
jgi:hypothetical protein